jgi:hypothetical protein
MPGEDRLTALLNQSTKRVTGIDFIRVVDPMVQRLLQVYFLIDPENLGGGTAPETEPTTESIRTFSEVPITAEQITITSSSGGERLAAVSIAGVMNAVGEGGRHIVEITTDEPGDFSLYRLFIDDARIDRFFNNVEFSFKQGCPSVLDCKPAEPECPPEAFVDFPIDYLARDFVSLRNALLDYAAQRYPQWIEKIEADAGVMLSEIMAALGDELSYIQDRYAREAYLETATQRRSLRHHTRLVDYTIHDGLTAGTFLDLTVKDNGTGNGLFVKAGSRVWAPVQGEPPIPFELGEGLNDQRMTLLTLLFSVGLEFQGDLNNGIFSATLRQEFADQHIFLADTPVPEVSIQDIDSRWLISYPTVTFLVARENDRLTIYGVGRQFWVHEAWNKILVHIPDPSQPCLPVGATELFLHQRIPQPEQLPGNADSGTFWVGKWLLLKTDPEDPSLPARRHLVRVVEVEHTTDPLCLDKNSNPLEMTRIKWEDEQALPCEMCLGDMVVRGNLVYATAGETITEFFTIGTSPNIPPTLAENHDRAVERQGALNDVTCERSVTFLYSLKQTETSGLGWLGDLRDARPEIELQEVHPLVSPQLWEWKRTLLDAQGFEDAFTLDDGTWRRIIGFRRGGEVVEHVDYASGLGFTIRFGDGEFGRIPPDGTVFQVRYRTGPGTRANLPADTVTNLTHPLDETQAELIDILDAVTNPLPITSGMDPESHKVIAQLAPEAFRAVTFRAVRPEDYEEIAERLPWVQRAGAQFRWTGSWLSTFVTADPLGSFSLTPERRTELENLMDCVRQVGREAFVRDPEFVNIDLDVMICIEPFAYAGQVKARVLEVLLGRKGLRPTKGFFHPDHFTFGTPLQRAALEATIQSVAGVRGVEQMRIRARGITDWRPFRQLVFTVADHQVIRLQNDPRFPERGSLRIVTMNDRQVGREERAT